MRNLFRLSISACALAFISSSFLKRSLQPICEEAQVKSREWGIDGLNQMKIYGGETKERPLHRQKHW